MAEAPPNNLETCRSAYLYNKGLGAWLKTRLRGDNLPLKIVLGRLANPSWPPGSENLLCQCCSRHIVEDAKHFVMECEAYSEERAEMCRSLVSALGPFVEKCDHARKVSSLFSAIGALPQQMNTDLHAGQVARPHIPPHAAAALRLDRPSAGTERSWVLEYQSGGLLHLTLGTVSTQLEAALCVLLESFEETDSYKRRQRRNKKKLRRLHAIAKGAHSVPNTEHEPSNTASDRNSSPEESDGVDVGFLVSKICDGVATEFFQAIWRRRAAILGGVPILKYTRGAGDQVVMSSLRWDGRCRSFSSKNT